MSESKTPTPQELRSNAEKLKQECCFSDWESFAIFLVQVNENVRSQLTTAQQEIAELKKQNRVLTENANSWWEVLEQLPKDGIDKTDGQKVLDYITELKRDKEQLHQIVYDMVTSLSNTIPDDRKL